MDEYIDRDSVLEIIQEKQKALCPAGRYGRSYVYESDREAYDAWEEILDAISAIPAADVAPVVHGRWEKIKPVHYQCSICRINTGGFTSNYCPNCGAKMDKETADGLDTP